MYLQIQKMLHLANIVTSYAKEYLIIHSNIED
jgi:hypothetical protein